MQALCRKPRGYPSDMNVHLVAAVSEGRILGKDDRLPWPRIKADMRFFRTLTIGHPIIMGRKTFESIGRKSLPNRTNIVVTRDTFFEFSVLDSHCLIENSLRAAFRKAREFNQDVFVIGGEGIFCEVIGFADQIHLTEIEAKFPGDRKFPEIDPTVWSLSDSREHPIGEDSPFNLCFKVFTRNIT